MPSALIMVMEATDRGHRSHLATRGRVAGGGAAYPSSAIEACEHDGSRSRTW
jgi:hypothetical protein